MESVTCRIPKGSPTDPSTEIPRPNGDTELGLGKSMKRKGPTNRNRSGPNIPGPNPFRWACFIGSQGCLPGSIPVCVPERSNQTSGSRCSWGKMVKRFMKAVQLHRLSVWPDGAESDVTIQAASPERGVHPGVISWPLRERPGGGHSGARVGRLEVQPGSPGESAGGCGDVPAITVLVMKGA
jgi:hypothetical protein